MSSAERRLAIVAAARPLFARKGFARTTTREMARAAGVSEALLYKHFPSKESLYAEIQRHGCREGDHALEKLATLEPSTSTLVHILYYWMRTLYLGKPGEHSQWEIQHRLVLNSCLEDGDYARGLLENRFGCCMEKIEACLEAAQLQGDLVPCPATTLNRMRFAHHIAAMMGVLQLPANPALHYEGTQEESLHQAIWFALRGLGLSDKALQRHYQPKALALFFGLGQK